MRPRRMSCCHKDFLCAARTRTRQPAHFRPSRARSAGHGFGSKHTRPGRPSNRGTRPENEGRHPRFVSFAARGLTRSSRHVRPETARPHPHGASPGWLREQASVSDRRASGAERHRRRGPHPHRFSVGPPIWPDQSNLLHPPAVSIGNACVPSDRSSDSECSGNRLTPAPDGRSTVTIYE